MPTDSRQEPARRRLGHDAAAGEHEPEPRGGAGEADVHRQRHRDPDADRGPVDRADHRLVRLEDPQRQHATAVARNAGIGLHVAPAPGERVAAGDRSAPAQNARPPR